MEESRRRRVRHLGLRRPVNHSRRHGEITGDNSHVTPAEFEAIYYRQTEAPVEAVTQ